MTSKSNGNPRGRPAGSGDNDGRLSARMPSALVAVVKAKADEAFATVSDWIVEAITEKLARSGGDAPAPAKAKDGLADAREREKLLDVQMKEMKFARERGELVEVANVLAFYESKASTIRSRLLSIPQSMPGLDREQTEELKTRLNEAMGDLAGEAKENWDDVGESE